MFKTFSQWKRTEPVLAGRQFPKTKEPHIVNNPYLDYVKAICTATEIAGTLPLGNVSRPERTQPVLDAKTAVFLAPHPDDESLQGAALFRLRDEGWRIIVVPVTCGSNPQRKLARLQEMQRACTYLGAVLHPIGQDSLGFDNITEKGRRENEEAWGLNTQSLARLLTQLNPSVLFFPHGYDWNGTHIGVHLLAMDALALTPTDFETHILLTDFWGEHRKPNLMLEVSPERLAEQIAAVSFHVGEVERNPYHLTLPAFMMNNVRLGAEKIGGQGGASPDFMFATLYEHQVWTGGKLRTLPRGIFIPKSSEERLSGLLYSHTS